jgi:hypothetical protein|tara:strand:- start:34 stop:351 length:318 start_codon:yes stop_codon:yes gene_type:complete
MHCCGGEKKGYPHLQFFKNSNGVMTSKTMYVFFWQHQEEGTKIIIHRQATNTPEETEAHRKLIWMFQKKLIKIYGYERYNKDLRDTNNYFFSPYPLTNAPEDFEI